MQSLETDDRRVLIDNAADALGDTGEIHLKNRVEDSWVVVEVEDGYHVEIH